jgi:hypothetical protein
MTGDTKTAPVRQALREKKQRLEFDELFDPAYTGDFSKTDLEVVDLSDAGRDDAN